MPTRTASPQVVNALRRRWLTNAGNQIGLAVPATNTSLAVTFIDSMATLAYGVIVTPNWNTTAWVTSKTITGCTVNFGTGAPGGGGLIDIAVYATEQT